MAEMSHPGFSNFPWNVEF